MAKLCMGCMNPLPEGNTTCTVCGFDPAVDQNPAHCLPVTAALQGHYIVGRLMSEASDHLLYLAYDRQLREPCFIQEFFPAGLSRRDTIGGVQPLEGCARLFEDYAARFRTMMRSLARMRELPSIVPVYDIFEENGTVYAVSDYCQGMTLTKKIKLSGGRISWAEARPLFMSLLSGLAALNDAGVLHLAISPDNILIGADGKARLRGFSIPATHRRGTDLNPDLKDGYAAPEQYDEICSVDTPADVYGMAATIFRTVTGNEPPAGHSRAKNSDDLFMSADVAEELTQPVCVALFNALQVQSENRTATVAELRDQLSLTPTVSALVDEVEEDMERTDSARNKAAKKQGNRTGKLLLIFGGCLLALAVVVLVVLLALGRLGGGDEGEVSEPAPTLPSYTIATRPTKPDGKIVVDNVVGLNYYDLRDTTLSGNIEVVIDHFVFSDKAAGTVVSQDPAASAEVEPGTPLKVVISNGRADEKLQVPDVRGWEQEQAKLYLEALGFRVTVLMLQNSTVDKGLVDGTDPKEGTEKRLGDMITLRVSNMETTTTTTQPPVTTGRPSKTTTKPTTTTTTTAVVHDPTQGDVPAIGGTDNTTGSTDGGTNATDPIAGDTNEVTNNVTDNAPTDPGTDPSNNEIVDDGTNGEPTA